jgi:hypothetical protein
MRPRHHGATGAAVQATHGQCALDGRGEQLLAVHHRVHQSKRPGLTRMQLPAGQEQAHGGRKPDESRQALGATAAGQQTQLDFRKPQARGCIAASHPRIGGQRELQPAAETGPVDGGHHRHGQRGESMLSGLG